MPAELNLESLFAAAADIDDEARRREFVASACGDDSELRRELEGLIAANQRIGDFMESPAGADLAPTAQLSDIGERPGSQIGPYKLLEQIGEGGMGLVFMAEQSRPLRRRVALKIIKPGLDTRSVIARFEAERQALALMDHPNIARVYDAGATENGRPYFVMELVRGAPITDYCRERDVPLRERLGLFTEVCHAVQHAHQKGIIHRDLKPTNILVSQSDTGPVPKVIDFGVAKATIQPLTDKTLFTHFAQVIGTPLYMSPEQADLGNQDIDTRSDVYSLGVVLYELLTGTTPFDAERLRSVGHDEMRRILREEDPPRPSTRATTVAIALTTAVAPMTGHHQISATALKGDLDLIVMKSLDKDRRGRYESPSALAADIQRYLTHEPIIARPATPLHKLSKWTRRHVAMVWTIVCVSLASAIGLGISTAAITASRNAAHEDRTRAVAGEEAAQRSRRLAEAARDAAEAARKAAVWSLYSSRMVQASTAWKDRDYAALRTLTGSIKEVEGGPDFRGWEWFFLDQQLRNAFAELPPGPAWRAAWHPRRSELAVVVPRHERRAAIEIWAPNRTEPIKTLALIPSDFDPSQDVQTVDHLLWSGDGARLAYVCHASDKTTDSGASWIVVLDVDSGRELFRQRAFTGDDPHIKHVTGFAISRNGDAIAAGNFYGQVKLWDVKSGALRSVLYDPKEEENHTYLEFSPAGNQLAAAFCWGRRAVWNLETGELFDHEQVGWGSDGVVRWSPDGKKLAATDSGTGVAIYEAGVRKPSKVLPVRGVRALCWRDAQTLMVGGVDRWISTWRVNDATKEDVLRVVDEPITSLDLNHDGSDLLINGAKPDAAKLVRLDHVVPFDDHIAGQQDEEGVGHLLAWSRDGSRLASVHTVHRDANLFTGDLRVFDRATKQVVLHRDPGLVRDLVWTQDDSALLAFTYHGSFHEFAIGASAGDRMEELPRNLDSYGASDFASDARQILYTDGENVVILNTASLEIGQQVIVGPHIRQLRVSPNAQQFFVGSYDWWRFFDVNTGKSADLQRTGDLSSWIHSAAYSPDAKTLAAGVGDGSIELWQTDPPKLINRLVGHEREPMGVDWSNDGRRLASAADDGTVRIWDAATGDAVAVFHLPSGVGVCSVEWSPNSQELAAGAINGDIYFFDAGPSFPGADLLPASEVFGGNLDEQ